ncbi:MAG: ATP synthase F1 subunit delta [Pseudomonadota bacterium]
MAGLAAQKIAERYGQAFFVLCQQHSLQDEIMGDLERIERCHQQSSDLRRLFVNPVIDRTVQRQAVEALIQALSCHKLTRHCISLLAERRRLAIVPAMIEAFRTRRNLAIGILSVEVTTARALDEGKQKQTADMLRPVLGEKIAIRYQVVPEILGGMMVRFASTLIDASTLTQLRKIEHLMKGI